MTSPQFIPPPAAPVTPAPTAQEPAGAPAAPPAGQEQQQAPWTAETFDAQRAWSLVENLRAEVAAAKSRPTVTAEQQQQLTEYQALVDASKSDAQRLQEAAATATREAEQARADAIRYKAAATHGITAEHFDLLGSGTEEEVTARAQKIAALAAQTQPQPTPGAPTTRPVEQLRAGATPSEPASEDDVIYARLFGLPKTT